MSFRPPGVLTHECESLPVCEQAYLAPGGSAMQFHPGTAAHLDVGFGYAMTEMAAMIDDDEATEEAQRQQKAWLESEIAQWTPAAMLGWVEGADAQ